MPAQTVTWTGGVDGDFDERNNWDLKIIPDSIDTVIVPKTTTQALATNLDRSSSGDAATGTITLTGQPLNTETVVIDGKTYTFQTSLTDSDGNVLIGATSEDSADNLVAAVTLGSGAGTAYAASMTIHTSVSAYDSEADDNVEIRAVTPGAAGNSIAMSETLTNGTVDATLSSGGTGISDYPLWFVERGAPAIGASGSPLKCVAKKVVHEGLSPFYLDVDYGSGSITSILRVIVNSANLVDAMFISGSTASAASVTVLEILSGHVTYSGIHGLTFVRMSNASGNSKPRLTTTSTGSTSNKIANVEIQTGQLVTGLPITTAVLGGGTLTTTATGGASGSETAGTVYQTGGLFRFNVASTIATFILMGGLLDTTQTAGTKTITDYRKHPSGTDITNDDFFGGTEVAGGV